MITLPSLRQIFSDKDSLHGYGDGRLPTFKDVTRRLFLCERNLDTRLPDHYYTRGRELALDGIDSLAGLLTAGLHRLGAAHLELTGNRVFVQGEMLPAWQELLTFCPPLPLMCGLLWKSTFCPGTRDPVALAEYMCQYLGPNTRHTCLPSPRFPQMEYMLREGGLSDLHMHLTGTTETDIAWQSYLRNPFAFYRSVKNKECDPKVREQLEQEVPGFTSVSLFYDWLTTAQLLRRCFVHLLFHGAYTPEMTEALKNVSVAALLRRQSIVGQQIPPTFDHPLRQVFRTGPTNQPNWDDATLEGLLYLLLMDQLDQHGDDKLANCFHYYLLILGFINRFLVQQVHQNGFDQFQKITLNDFRNTPEETYARRFFQLHGNDGRNLYFLEGRFAPKTSVLETIRLLNKITRGWQRFRSSVRRQKMRRPKLRLVCHFIKERDSKEKDSEIKEGLPVFAIRHRTLRISNMRKARALVTARESYPGMKEFITGADAASNELETPPEVYAPVFRYLRRSGFNHFTFHAGEDFHHLVGGLRAIFEAVEFLGFQRGDRIGHATAAGIEPQLWRRHVGDTLVMSQGEWLDDLLFVIHFCERQLPCSLVADKLASVRAEAIALSQQIYGKHYSVHSHIQAWLLRQYCPFHLLHELEDAMQQPLWCPDEWRLCVKERQENEAIKLLRLYHRADCRKRYHSKTRIRVTEILELDILRQLQNLLLAWLHEREIVLEVLPTSNVRISFYKELGEHHIWRWLGVGQQPKTSASCAPPVVIGTDDTGIFSTNIYNEYNQVYHHLTIRGIPHDQAAGTIRQIMENARIYRFEG